MEISPQPLVKLIYLHFFTLFHGNFSSIVSETNLFASIYRLFHEDFSSLVGEANLSALIYKLFHEDSSQSVMK